MADQIAHIGHVVHDHHLGTLRLHIRGLGDLSQGALCCRYGVCEQPVAVLEFCLSAVIISFFFSIFKFFDIFAILD